MLVDKLTEHALKKVCKKKIKDIRVGLSYTCVMLDDGGCGVAYTFRNELGHCCGLLRDFGNLAGKDAAEIIPWVKSNNLLKAAIGLATINAVLNDIKADWETGNVTSVLDVGPSDNFGMIGEFKPILSEIKKKTKNIYVFELNVQQKDIIYPSDSIPLYLPECDAVIITATSIINHTFDDIIIHCKKARQICLVGPSATLCPEAFAGYNVTLLAGSAVANPEKVLQVVSQGGGTMAMRPFLKQVLIPVKNR